MEGESQGAYEEDGAAGAPHEVEKRTKVAPVLHEAPLRLIPAPERKIRSCCMVTTPVSSMATVNWHNAA